MSSLIDCQSAPNADTLISTDVELLAALRARIDQLEISYATLEALAGIPLGYASKVLGSPVPMKRIQLFSTMLLITALGLRVRLEEDPALTERYRGRWEKRKMKRPNKSAVEPQSQAATAP